MSGRDGFGDDTDTAGNLGKWLELELKLTAGTWNDPNSKNGFCGLANTPTDEITSTNTHWKQIYSHIALEIFCKLW